MGYKYERPAGCYFIWIILGRATWTRTSTRISMISYLASDASQYRIFSGESMRNNVAMYQMIVVGGLVTVFECFAGLLIGSAPNQDFCFARGPWRSSCKRLLKLTWGFFFPLLTSCSSHLH